MVVGAAGVVCPLFADVSNLHCIFVNSAIAWSNLQLTVFHAVAQYRVFTSFSKAEKTYIFQSIGPNM